MSRQLKARQKVIFVANMENILIDGHLAFSFNDATHCN